MPTQIDFYLLPTDDKMQKWLFACRLTNKVFGMGKRVCILTSDEQQTRKMDQLLWTWSPGSFVPHQNCTDDDSADDPVYISHVQPPPEFSDILVNLTDEKPECLDQFARVVEFVGTDEKEKQAARSRYKIYRDLGVEPKTVTIKTI